MLSKSELKQISSKLKTNKHVTSLKVTKANNLYVCLDDAYKKRFRNSANYTTIMIRRSPFGLGNITINVHKVNAFYTYHFRNTYENADQLIPAIEKYINKIM
ncbi:MAG: hypothetical protein RSE41_00465 [Clostridia bacterium]